MEEKHSTCASFRSIKNLYDKGRQKREKTEFFDRFINCKIRLKPNILRRILNPCRRPTSPHRKKNRDNIKSRFRCEYLGQLRQHTFKKERSVKLVLLDFFFFFGSYDVFTGL